MSSTATWLIPGLETDIQEDWDKIILDHIKANYSLDDPDINDTETFKIKVGFFDYHRPYEIAILETDTRIEQWLNARNPYVSTGIEVWIRMKRISRDKPDPQLGQMEREIIRIAGQYHIYTIPGVKMCLWDGGARMYNGADTFAKSDWQSVVRYRLFYERRDISPP